MSTHTSVVSAKDIAYGWDPTFQTYFVQVRISVSGKWVAWTGTFPFEHTDPEGAVRVLSKYLPEEDLQGHAELLRTSAG